MLYHTMLETCMLFHALRLPGEQLQFSVRWCGVFGWLTESFKVSSNQKNSAEI